LAYALQIFHINAKNKCKLNVTITGIYIVPHSDKTSVLVTKTHQEMR